MTAADSKGVRAPSLWPFLLLCAATSLVLSGGTIHKHHNSDSLIPILESLYRWTPYFWIQNRIGVPVALLAVPIHHPLLNLLFQSFFYIFAGLAATFLLLHFLLRNAAFAVVAGFSVAAMVGQGPTWFCWLFYLNTFYGVWLALGCGGLVFLEVPPQGGLSWRRQVAAVVLLALAHWVYLATILLLGPLVVFRYLLCEPSPGTSRLSEPASRPAGFWHPLRLELLLSLLYLTVGFLVGFAMMQLTPAPMDDLRLGGIPLAQWPESWRLMAEHSWSKVNPHHWYYFLFGSAGLGVLLWGVPRIRRQAGPVGRASVVLLASALTYQLFMGTRSWVFAGHCDVRYCLPGIFFVQAALALVALAPLCLALHPHWRCWLDRAVGPAMLLAAVSVYGLPSLSTVRSSLDGMCHFGVNTEEVLATHSTHIAGDYWKVWSTMFHANLLQHERGGRPIWGLTLRSEPTRRYWERIPHEEMRVAVPLGDEKLAAFWFCHLGLPEMERVESYSTVTIWRPKDAVAKSSRKAPPSTP